MTESRTEITVQSPLGFDTRHYSTGEETERLRTESLRVAVIVVSCNTCALLRACLQSIAVSGSIAAEMAMQIDTVVVDNASHDDSIQMVATEFPRVRLLELDQNVGFSAGNNLGLKLLGFDVETSAALPAGIEPDLSSGQPDFVLLLNPDAELIDTALLRMTNFLLSTPAAGGCGAQLHYADGSFQHGAFRLPSLGQVLLDLYPLSSVRGAHRLHNSRLNGRYPAVLWGDSQPFLVDFVLGASIMVRGSLIDQIGGLDEGFYMYCEEMDWCVRLAQSGHPIYAVPNARVLHHAGKSSNQVRWPMVVQLWRSRLRFYAKYRDLYPARYEKLLRVVTKSGFARKARQIQARVDRGEADQADLQAELDAYAEIQKMLL